jgi:acyl carrier protein
MSNLPTTEAEILDTFSDVLIGTFQVPVTEVTAETTFAELDLDSLDRVEMTLVIEERTGVRISDDELADITTVGDAVAVVAAKRAAA